MLYTSRYNSPLGEMLLAADEVGLTGLWFVGQKYFAQQLSANATPKNTSTLKQTKEWLNIYFAGNCPTFTPPLHFIGTEFQKEIWNILLSVPYGHTICYGNIATQLTKNGKKMSAQAVGGAVGHNKISIIVPCHRIVGRNGKLTGYAGGIARKARLLELENVGNSLRF